MRAKGCLWTAVAHLLATPGATGWRYKYSVLTRLGGGMNVCCLCENVHKIQCCICICSIALATILTLYVYFAFLYNWA